VSLPSAAGGEEMGGIVMGRNGGRPPERLGNRDGEEEPNAGVARCGGPHPLVKPSPGPTDVPRASSHDANLLTDRLWKRQSDSCSLDSTTLPTVSACGPPTLGAPAYIAPHHSRCTKWRDRRMIMWLKVPSATRLVGPG
jgi:hypothetical protein